jgi:predicted AlkP superfamily pyrophosphatase or phosphodiesterase
MQLWKNSTENLIVHVLSVLALSASALSFAATPLSEEKLVTKKQAKLVIVVVVDGLPYEQLMRYREQFGQGGFRRLLEHGASLSNAHQAHGVTVTCVGHAAILTGAYPYQHGIIANNWTAPSASAANAKSVYCAEDTAYRYLGEETKPADGTAPTKLRASTLGDELHYASGGQSKVIAVSGKDRGAIMLAGKSGTAYMFMSQTGRFASTSYYMAQHPDWHTRFHATKPQEQFYGTHWTPLLSDKHYANDAQVSVISDHQDEDAAAPPATTLNGKPILFAFKFDSNTGKPDADYYKKLKISPHIDALTLQFAQAAFDGERLGQNGATDILAISLSNHDYINHAYGPESPMSHDHLLRLDRAIAQFFLHIDKKIGLGNTLVVLTSDHGFPNTPEFALANKADAGRIDSKKLVEAINQHLNQTFGVTNAVIKTSIPTLLLDYEQIQAKGLKRAEVEEVAARFALSLDGIAHTYTRTQMENGMLPDHRIAKLMQRAWHRQLSGDIVLVAKPYWIFNSGKSGTTHGAPYTYDTNVPLLMMGKPWLKHGSYGNYAEVMDIAPTLSHLLKIRPPSASEGRVLDEILK